MTAMIHGAMVLSALLGAAPPEAAPAGPEYPPARFTFGPLRGKRQMVLDRERIYYLSGAGEKEAGGELRVAEKPLDGAGGSPVPSPKPIGRLVLSGVPDLLRRIDGTRLCAGTGNHLAVIDASDPRKPRLVETIPVARREIDGAGDIAVTGPRVLVAARRAGLLRFDLDDPARPRLPERIALPGFATGIDVAGDLAAVATGVGISLVRAGKGELRLESSLDTLRHLETLRIAGKRVIAGAKEYLVVIDISDPLKPREVSETPTRDYGFFSTLVDLHVEGDIVLAAAMEGGFYGFRLAEGGAPELLVQYSFWGSERRLTDEGRLGYLKALGIEVSPADLGRLLPTVEGVRVIASGMAVEGRRAWIADWKGALWGFDVSLEGDRKVTLVVRPD